MNRQLYMSTARTWLLLLLLLVVPNLPICATQDAASADVRTNKFTKGLELLCSRRALLSIPDIAQRLNLTVPQVNITCYTGLDLQLVI
jgi:hypothetical protein